MSAIEAGWWVGGKLGTLVEGVGTGEEINNWILVIEYHTPETQSWIILDLIYFLKGPSLLSSKAYFQFWLCLIVAMGSQRVRSFRICSMCERGISKTKQNTCSASFIARKIQFNLAHKGDRPITKSWMNERCYWDDSDIKRGPYACRRLEKTMGLREVCHLSVRAKCKRVYWWELKSCLNITLNHFSGPLCNFTWNTQV